VLLRALFTVGVVGVFAWYFLFHAIPSWQATYVRFHVPAMAYPGGDARNIQMMAHCLNQGVAVGQAAACVKDGGIVRAEHPQATVPAYNYPMVWARGYAWLADDSEQVFLTFWRCNAMALILAVAAFCWRHAWWALPGLLLSPVTLLTIERGNIDGATFAVAMLGMLVAGVRPGLSAFGLGVATVMKVYPLMGLAAALGWAQRAGRLRVAAVAALVCSPFIVWTLLGMADFVSGTSTGYPFSYGLLALSHVPAWGERSAGLIAAVATVGLVGIVAGVAMLNARPRWTGEADAAWQAMPPADALLMLVSLAVYTGTFWVFTNWAYRLVFLFPALLIAWRQPSQAFKWFAWNAAAVIWLPVWRRHGWEAQTWACYPLAVWSSFLLWRWMQVTRVKAA
jgi:hypothetical protein